MLKRRRTKKVKVGSVKIGGDAHVVIQSMTKRAASDIAGTLREVKRLACAGAELVRIAVPTSADSVCFAKIVDKSPVPLIADIHFSASRAIEAIEGGAAKIRLNPGNIKKHSDILRIIDSAKMHRTPVRIGVNEASIRDLKKKNVSAQRRTALMLGEMKKYVRIFEKRNFDQIVLSAKSADALRTIEVNRCIAETFDYPIHIGLTHAGLPEDAVVPSSVALGTLLAEGIGDTIRVSVAGPSIDEVIIAKQILSSLGLYRGCEVELIVCPTCGRAQIDVIKLARQVKKALAQIHKPLRVAVMGCIVNGPGEAADADLAVCAAKNKGYIYRHGRKIAVVPEKKIITTMLAELEKL